MYKYSIIIIIVVSLTFNEFIFNGKKSIITILNLKKNCIIFAFLNFKFSIIKYKLIRMLALLSSLVLINFLMFCDNFYNVNLKSLFTSNRARYFDFM